MRKLYTAAREPMLHFLLIGLALFILYNRVAPAGGDSSRIEVSQSQVDEMVRQFQSTWNRPPSAPEMRGLVETFVREEIAYREGVAIGLDKDDAVIKRRIRQKYELITEEENRSAPSDADLAAFLNANPAKFARPGLVTFEQIFFDPASTSPEAVDQARAALARGGNPASFGQPSMLPNKVGDSAIDQVASEFGDGFARSIESVPAGRWVGPIASGFGVHLVLVDRRAAPVVPPLAQVRAVVAREWESDQRGRAAEAAYRKIRAGYDVRVKAKLP